MARWALAAGLALLTAGGAVAATEGEQDVSHPLTTLLVDRHVQSHPISTKSNALDPKRELILEDRGNIAIVDDGDGVGLPAFPFDLNGKTVEVLPLDETAAAYTYRAREGGYDLQAAATGEFLTLGDDAVVLLPLGFAFPYFGVEWEEVFIHSDGHLTFGEADVAQSARDPARAVSGPPRIAPFFWDLDPSREGAAVRYLRDGNRLTVTWINVPEWTPGAVGLRQNFQATLFADGRIELAYQSITIDLGTIGVASGEDIFESLAVDFSEPAREEPFTAAFVELFFPADLNLATLGRKFYLTHEDAYDFLVIFHDYELEAETGAFAFYRAVRNFTQGVGPWPAGFEQNNLVDFGQVLGSGFRLQGLMFMGALDKYPDDPRQRIDREEGVHRATAASVLAHEAGHVFLATPLLPDPASGLFSFDLLGRQLAHWSYFFNSEASFLEGNRIVDHGSGGSVRFETTDTVEGFSMLDRYLLGLVEPEAVPPSFFVRDPSIGGANFSEAHFPLGGVFFGGERVDVSIDQIREAMGRRKPDHTIAQKEYRYAFILLTQEGSEPSEASIAKMERFREDFERMMRAASGGGWQAETELKKQLTFVTWPATGVLAGERVDGGVLLGSTRDHDLTVKLSAGPGVSIPDEVVVPAGSLFEPFDVEGVEGGVTEIVGDAGEEFETARSFIQVQPGARNLRADRLLLLELLFGDPSERLKTGIVGRPMPFSYFVQAIDDNDLFYADAPIRITPSGDGSVEPAETVTDEFGFAVFDWTLATQPGANTVTVEVVGSERPPLVIEAEGVYAPVRQRNPRREILR